jgi:predicted nucleic acid-binding protein
MSAHEVFVDSTAWIALLHSRDELHSRAVDAYQRLLGNGRRLITTSLVLVEVASALSASRYRPLAVELERRCRESRIGEVAWVDEPLYRNGWELYR